MPPFSEPFETSLVHIPMLFFIVGFLCKIAAFFVTRIYMEELALCCLMLAASGVLGGFLRESGLNDQELRAFGNPITRGQAVNLMFGLTVMTAAVCFVFQVFGRSGLVCKMLGLVLYGLLLASVFTVARFDDESLDKYADELTAAVPSFNPPH
ncbi:hypothetical protein [Flavobacterium caeni]|uniref:Uncharacterized protein n=1 Tax=Flavobacterium caeni TaxID=490189 RepID=A0A1G5BKE6_9FLAO|nr:hypothetical protein [Flavobacterium caeni]SCX90662.1 hypothetical protein SAMN02927903_00401 [Flavobacterium caeni]